MPKWKATLDDGRVVTLEGDTQPTEADVIAAIGSYKPVTQTTTSPPPSFAAMAAAPGRSEFEPPPPAISEPLPEPKPVPLLLSAFLGDVNRNVLSTATGLPTAAGGTRGLGRLPTVPELQLTEPAIPIPKPQVKPDDTFISALAKEGAAQVLSLPEFMETPLGIASMGIGATGKIGQAVVRGGFLADTIYNFLKNAPGQVDQFTKATPAEKGKLIADWAATGGMIGLLGSPEIGKVIDRTKRILPRATQAAAEVLAEIPEKPAAPAATTEVTSASEIPSPEVVPQLEVRPQVGEETPLRQQGKPAPASEAQAQAQEVAPAQPTPPSTGPPTEAAAPVAVPEPTPQSSAKAGTTLPEVPSKPLFRFLPSVGRKGLGKLYRASNDLKQWTQVGNELNLRQAKEVVSNQNGELIAGAVEGGPESPTVAEPIVAPVEKPAAPPAAPAAKEPPAPKPAEGTVEAKRTPFNELPTNEIGLNEIQQAEWDKVTQHPEDYGGAESVKGIIEKSNLTREQKDALAKQIKAEPQTKPAEGRAVPATETAPLTELYLSWSPKEGGMIMGENRRTSADVITWAKQQIKSLQEEVKQHRTEEKTNREAYKTSPNRRVMGGLAPESIRAMGAKMRKQEAQAKIDFLKSRIAEHERIIEATQKPPLPAGPGAKTAGTTGEAGGTLQQLTQFIRGQSISPKESLTQTLRRAFGLADAWSKGKDQATAAIGHARAASAALLDRYLKLPAWDDFQGAIGRWTGADQETSLEVRRFQKAINRAVPNKLRQEAITNWIQAEGNDALLGERADASQGRNRAGYEAALTLNENEKLLARNISNYLDARLQEGIDAGILKQGVDHYVNQVWQRPTTATQRMWADLFGVGTLNPNFKFAKRRIFDSYFEGEQAGFVPKNKSIGSLIAIYDSAFNRAISARALIKELQNGTAADGKPITMTSGKTSPIMGDQDIPEAFLIKPNLAPEGAVSADGRPYRPIDHWALRDWKWATKGPEGQNVFVQGDMLVHPDHWNHLNNVLKTSRLAQHPITRPILKTGALLKQTKLSLSLFHLDQEGLHGVFHRINPVNLDPLDLSIPEQKGLVEHGLMVSDPRAMELFAEGSTGGGLVGKIPGLGQLQSFFNDWLFREYIPRLKINMALDALARNRKTYAKAIESGRISDGQIQALTARESNAAFGELNYRQMGRSPNVQDFLRLAVLAPDFLEARTRFVGQALKPYGREQQVALGLMAATLYVGSRIANQYLDGEPHWNKPFSVIYKGREYKLRTVLGDVYHLFNDPRSFSYNRLSPTTRTIIEAVTRRDDRGIKRTSVEQLQDLASWVIPIPLQRRSDQTIGESMLGSAGASSKSASKVQEVYALADDWMKKSGDPKLLERIDRLERETHVDSPYKPLRDALIKNDLKSAKKAYNELLKSNRKPAQISQQLSPYTADGFYKSFISAEADAKFKASLTPQQRIVYAQAIAERRELYRRFRAMLQSPAL